MSDLYNFYFGYYGDYTSIDFTEDDLISSSYDFEFGSGKQSNYYIFKGTSNNFNTIWCDANASLKTGTFYVTRTGDLSIVKNTELSDFYSNTDQGSINTTLISDDIIDINVSS